MPEEKNASVLRGIACIYAPQGGLSYAFQDSRFPHSSKGLRILKDGDFLTIYSPENPTEILWSGVISFYLRNRQRDVESRHRTARRQQRDAH